MKSQTKLQLSNTIEEIDQGIIDVAHIENLFFHLRFEKGVEPLIKELGDFSAHEMKNRGESFDFAIQFADTLLDFAQNGGSIGGHLLITTQLELADQLIESLRELGFSNEERYVIRKKSVSVMQAVIDMLDGSEFETKNPMITKIQLSKHVQDDIPRLYIEVYPVQTGETTPISSPGGMKFGPNTAIGAEIFKAIPVGSSETNATSIRISQRVDG